MYNFGTGLLEFTPAGSNPTPLQCGVLQEVSFDYIPGAIKKLYGQYQFPVDAAQAEGDITGKAKFAQIFGRNLQQVLSGATIATGSVYPAINEVGTVPGTPYQVTVTNSATFNEDLGVFDVNTERFLTRVAAAPATGQYAVTAGVYTFAAADTTHVMWISYSYTSAGGKTVSYSNQLMGSMTRFTMTLFNTYNSKNYGIKLFAACIPKLSMAFKNNDFTMQDIDITAFANSAGVVMAEYTSE